MDTHCALAQRGNEGKFTAFSPKKLDGISHTELSELFKIVYWFKIRFVFNSIFLTWTWVKRAKNSLYFNIWSVQRHIPYLLLFTTPRNVTVAKKRTVATPMNTFLMRRKPLMSLDVRRKKIKYTLMNDWKLFS